MSSEKETKIQVESNQSGARLTSAVVLLLHAAALLGFAVILARFYRFGAINVCLTALPALGVFLAGTSKAISGRGLALASLPIQLAALMMPALRLASDLAYGYKAFLLSFFGISLFGNWGPSAEHFWYPVGCLLGAVVNLLFLFGYVSIVLRRFPAVRWSASVAFSLSLLVTFALVLSTELNGLYVGHGLWVASLLALSLGSWRHTQPNPSTNKNAGRLFPTEGKRKKAVLAGIASLMVLLPTVTSVVWQMQASLESREDEVVIRENDNLITQDVDQQITRHFAELSSSDPLSERYGRFVRWEGGGYSRYKSMLGGQMLSLPRRAIFENIEVDCSIEVWVGPTRNIQVRMYPDPQWLADHPEHRLEQRGSELVHVGPNMSGSTSLQITVTHPDLFHTVAQRDRNESQQREIQSLLEQLAANDDTAVANWLAEQKRSQPIAAFVRQSLQRKEIDIQIQAIKLLRGSESNKRGYLPEEAVTSLLEVVKDAEANPQVRREIVNTLIRPEQSDNKIYGVLRDLGPEGHFAINAVVALVSDRSQSHWQAGLSANAPVEAVELLGFWGAAAGDAVPVLASVVRGEHPNQWSFAPAAAEALGNIGPPAKSAIPDLILATKSSHSKLANKAEEALKKLRPQSTTE